MTRLEPIMLLKLPIMLLSSAPKSSLLCSKLCSANLIMLIGTVKFNRIQFKILYSSLRSIYIVTPIMWIHHFYHCIHQIIHKNSHCKFAKRFTNSSKLSLSWEKCALHKNFTYYAGIMLDAFAILLCSKLCWHNWLKPSVDKNE